MDYEKMRESVKRIRMSDDMKARIKNKCKSETVQEMEDIAMKKNKVNGWSKKWAVAAVVAALCLCFAVGAVAAGNSGYFKDVTDWTGAVVGTRYEQATDEIEVSVAAAEDGITVCAVFVNPDAFPYRELDNFGIDSYRIVDMSGKTVIEGERTDLFEIADGKAEIKIAPNDIADGEYKLVIDAFVGDKKADQPLRIGGEWECGFSL